MSHDTATQTETKRAPIRFAKLFEVGNAETPSPPAGDAQGRWAGVTTYSVCPSDFVRCVPLTLRMAEEVIRRFEMLEINCGVERLLASESARASAKERDEPDVLLPVVMERGMDFSVTVKNISPEPALFLAQVWGYPEVPETHWKQQLVGAEFFVECCDCGHRYVLKPGGRWPLWCGMCVEQMWIDAREGDEVEA